MDADRYAASAAHMERAHRVLTRGVGSALRAAQRPTPLAVAEASGSRLVDVDGNAYIDYVLGFGPILLGHRPPAVVRAVEEQLRRGILYGAQHQGEVELAEQLVELIPSAELVAFSSSGSEAIQAALRFARAATGRQLVIKFDPVQLLLSGSFSPFITRLSGSRFTSLPTSLSYRIMVRAPIVARSPILTFPTFITRSSKDGSAARSHRSAELHRRCLPCHTR